MKKYKKIIYYIFSREYYKSMSISIRLNNLEKKINNFKQSEEPVSDNSEQLSELQKIINDLTQKVSSLETRLEECSKENQTTSEISNINTKKIMQVIQPLQTSLTSVEKRVANLE